MSVPSVDTWENDKAMIDEYLTKQARMLALSSSATRYSAVDIATEDWVPEDPFRGIIVSVAGNVVIRGLDGVDSPALPLEAGVHALGGAAIVKTGTTATIVSALF